MTNTRVAVIIMHGNNNYMQKVTENDILPENVPNVARLLMDDIYLRLDDQVSTAQLRAHRRDLRAKKREKPREGAKNGE